MTGDADVFGNADFIGEVFFDTENPPETIDVVMPGFTFQYKLVIAMDVDAIIKMCE